MDEKPPVKEYRGKDIVVRFDPARCIKVGECGRGLPVVFRAGQDPWAVPDAATADEIVDVIHRCPSGALTYERLDGGPQEEPPKDVVITPRKHGPLYVRGDVTLTDERGNPIPTAYRMALCRCGHSENKPFCDDSHSRVGWRSSAPKKLLPRADA